MPPSCRCRPAPLAGFPASVSAAVRGAPRPVLLAVPVGLMRGAAEHVDGGAGGEDRAVLLANFVSDREHERLTARCFVHPPSACGLRSPASLRAVRGCCQVAVPCLPRGELRLSAHGPAERSSAVGLRENTGCSAPLCPATAGGFHFFLWICFYTTRVGGAGGWKSSRKAVTLFINGLLPYLKAVDPSRVI